MAGGADAGAGVGAGAGAGASPASGASALLAADSIDAMRGRWDGGWHGSVASSAPSAGFLVQQPRGEAVAHRLSSGPTGSGGRAGRGVCVWLLAGCVSVCVCLLTGCVCVSGVGLVVSCVACASVEVSAAQSVILVAGRAGRQISIIVAGQCSSAPIARPLSSLLPPASQYQQLCRECAARAHSCACTPCPQHIPGDKRAVVRVSAPVASPYLWDDGRDRAAGRSRAIVCTAGRRAYR